MSHRMKQNQFTLGIGVSLVLTALMILIIACFAAFTFASADSEMKRSEADRSYCDHYYAAETAATEIITGLSESTIKLPEDKNGKTVCDSSRGSVVISRNENTYTFVVPIDSKQSLAVVARISTSHTEVLQWTVVSQEISRK